MVVVTLPFTSLSVTIKSLLVSGQPKLTSKAAENPGRAGLLKRGLLNTCLDPRLINGHLSIWSFSKTTFLLSKVPLCSTLWCLMSTITRIAISLLCIYYFSSSAFRPTMCPNYVSYTFVFSEEVWYGEAFLHFLSYLFTSIVLNGLTLCSGLIFSRNLLNRRRFLNQSQGGLFVHNIFQVI